MCDLHSCRKRQSRSRGTRQSVLSWPENTQTHSVSGKLWTLNGRKEYFCIFIITPQANVCSGYFNLHQLDTTFQIVYPEQVSGSRFSIFTGATAPVLGCLRKLFCMRDGDVYKVSPALESLHTAPVKPQERASWKLLVNRTSGNWQLHPTPPHPPPNPKLPAPAQCVNVTFCTCIFTPLNKYFFFIISST